MEEENIGIIPAAGKGLRLGLPYPKELFPVIVDQRYKPISQFVLDNLTGAGVRHIVFVINSSKHHLMEFFGDGHRFGCQLSYAVQEIRPIENDSTSPGLACALDSAYHLVRGKKVFFGMADTMLKPADVFARAHIAAGPDGDYDAILLLFPTDRPQDCGMVDLTEEGIVRRVIDKPGESALSLMWGGMIWRPSFTEHLHACVRNRNMFDFAAILNDGIQNGLRIGGVRVPDSTYCDIGTYDSIQQVFSPLDR
jgi:dTDP-glucose pyrophosphorylase